MSLQIKEIVLESNAIYQALGGTNDVLPLILGEMLIVAYYWSKSIRGCCFLQWFYLSFYIYVFRKYFLKSKERTFIGQNIFPYSIPIDGGKLF